MRKVLVILSSVALLLSLTSTAALAKPNTNDKHRLRGDNFPGVLATKQTALRQAAIEKVIAGTAKARGDNKVVKLAPQGGGGNGNGGIFVELAFEGEDQILTLLGEFGDDPATHDHGADGIINHGGDPGPLHNEIPKPNRLGVDNTTPWQADYSQAYYDRILYDKTARPSMANWYLEQSSGRYSVDGYVSDWLQVPNNGAAYGSDSCGSIVCTRDVGRFIEDQADTWWDILVADEGSVGAANAFLSRFDVWDRYDWDGDGDFDEPDGYIDHFQSVHAGEGQETGGGVLGDDAIWSHRSYVDSVPIFSDGPPAYAPFGGAHIGASDYWIGDYTIEPENGEVATFAHEFGHDLGLPDLYDTSQNTGGAENGTGWWTVMSQGAYGSISNDLSTYPPHFGAWEKLQLGWLNYDVATHGVKKQRFTLGPAEKNSIAGQALVVPLPDKSVTQNIGTPFAGSFYYFSDNGSDLNNTMTRQVAIPSSSGSVTASFKGRWHIEPCYDFGFLEVSTNGTDFTSIETSASTDEDLGSLNPDGTGISGISGTPTVCDDDLSPTPVWVDVTADLSAYAGMSVWLRFRYATDPAVTGNGLSIDNLQITGLPVDGAETDPGWDYDGFIRTNGRITTQHAHYYIAEFRKYIGYDRSLQRGPYSYVSPTGLWTERFPYQDGLLISYWDTSQEDNNVGDHPGRGLILPIDSHPSTFNWSDGSVARPRIQSYDATFTLAKTDPITLHRPGAGGVLDVDSRKAKSVFDDMKNYWRSSDPGDGAFKASWNSVRNPHTHTTIRILRIYHNGNLMDIRVN